MEGVQLFEDFIQAMGIPDQMSRPWLEEKLKVFGFSKETLTLEQARELTSEMVMEFFLKDL
jgi:hypothetical protein